MISFLASSSISFCRIFSGPSCHESASGFSISSYYWSIGLSPWDDTSDTVSSSFYYLFSPTAFESS
jgi:hypothetical protein